MILSPSGTGIQKLFAHANPTFVWDAQRAGRAIGNIPLTIVDNDARAASSWFRWSDGRLEKMTATSDTAAGAEQVFGPCGDFHGGATTSTYTYNLSRLGLTEVAPTAATSWVSVTDTYPDIFKPGVTTTDHHFVVEALTDLDAVNDVVAERSQSRSATYARDLTFFVKSAVGTDPTGNVELGWNTTAETRTTEAPRVRKLPNSDWYSVSIIVPSNATTAGYASIKFVKSTGTWQACCARFCNIYTEHEYISRLVGGMSFDRGKWDVHTTNAELQLRPEGWLALCIVLPDRSVSNGHTDYAGAANYKFGGIFNLDCGLYRLRASMSDTFDRIAVNLGTTAGVNFAFLDGPTAWTDFTALGIVVTWEISNGSRYASLYINGEKYDAVANPADWYPANLAPGTAYIGISGANGTPAECNISRVAYGNSHMHRSYARNLSRQLQKLSRGYEGTV